MNEVDTSDSSAASGAGAVATIAPGGFANHHTEAMAKVNVEASTNAYWLRTSFGRLRNASMSVHIVIDRLVGADGGRSAPPRPRPLLRFQHHHLTFLPHQILLLQGQLINRLAALDTLLLQKGLEGFIIVMHRNNNLGFELHPEL